MKKLIPIYIIMTLCIISFASADFEKSWFKFENGFNDTGNNINITSVVNASIVNVSKLGISSANISQTGWASSQHNKNLTGYWSGNHDWSVSFWVNYNNLEWSSTQVIALTLGNFLNGQSNQSLTFGSGNTVACGGAFYCAFVNINGETKNFNLANLSSNVWVHYTFSYESVSRNVSFFFNGTLINKSAFVATPNLVPSQAIIGNLQNQSTLGNIGLLDDLRIFNWSINQSGDAFLYNNGSGNASSYGFDVIVPLNVSARDNTTNTPINTFSLSALDLNTSLSSSYSVSNVASINIVAFDWYNLTFNAPGYPLSTVLYVSNTSVNQALNQSLLSASLNLSIFNEASGLLTNLNSSVSLVGDHGFSKNSVINGSGIISGLVIDNYTISISQSGFNSVAYYFNVNQQFNNLSIYLNNGTAILLNYRDSGGNPISGVLANISSYVNGTLVPVSQQLSVLGTVQFYALSNKYYTITSTKAGYIPNVLNLPQVLFTSYTIPMSLTSNINATPTGYAVWSPTVFFNGQNGTFVIQFVSPFNNFVSYNYNLTTPSGSTYNNGSISGGQTFSNAFNISASGSAQNIILRYNFLLSDGSIFSQNITYRSIAPFNNKTLVNMGSKRYGMLVGDRIGWFLIIMIFFMGVLFLGGGLNTALIGGGLLLWIFTKNGFLGIDGSAPFLVPAIVLGLYLLLRAWYNR